MYKNTLFYIDLFESGWTSIEWASSGVIFLVSSGAGLQIPMSVVVKNSVWFDLKMSVVVKFEPQANIWTYYGTCSSLKLTFWPMIIPEICMKSHERFANRANEIYIFTEGERNYSKI